MTSIRARLPAAMGKIGRRVFPLGFCGMVALIMALERFVAPRPGTSDRVGRVEMSWNGSAAAAEGGLARADVLCLGDSLIKLGILPRVLEDRLGLSAYNLGVLGGQAPSSYYLLRRVLNKGIRPRALMVDFSEHLLSLAPGLNPTCWADSVGCSRSLELAWHSGDPALAISAGLHWLLPRWCDRRHSDSLSSFRSDKKAADDPRVFERNWHFNRGAQVAPRAFVPVEELLSVNADQWRPHPANAFYVDRLLGAAQAEHIPVFWILTPSDAPRREQLEQNGVHAAYRKFIAERLAAYSCVTVLDGRQLCKSKDAFRDPIHVNRDGAIQLSVAVAAAIRPRLSEESSTARWIDLVEIADQESSRFQELVEDLDQSRAALTPLLVGQSSTEVASW
jgi:hypothetical protein